MGGFHQPQAGNVHKEQRDTAEGFIVFNDNEDDNEDDNINEEEDN